MAGEEDGKNMEGCTKQIPPSIEKNEEIRELHSGKLLHIGKSPQVPWLNQASSRKRSLSLAISGNRHQEASQSLDLAPRFSPAKNSSGPPARRQSDTTIPESDLGSSPKAEYSGNKKYSHYLDSNHDKSTHIKTKNHIRLMNFRINFQPKNIIKTSTDVL